MNTRFDPILLGRFFKLQISNEKGHPLLAPIIIDIQYETVYSSEGRRLYWNDDKTKPLFYNLDNGEFYYVENPEHKPNRDLSYN